MQNQESVLEEIKRAYDNVIVTELGRTRIMNYGSNSEKALLMLFDEIGRLINEK